MIHAPSIQLTERDVALLIDLYKYRYLSTPQISSLHFPSDRTAWRRLQKLFEGRWITRFKSPAISEYLYHLDTAGFDLVAEHLDVNPDRLPGRKPSQSPKDYYFLRHFLKINDFRIALTQACNASSELELVGFIPEYLGRKTEGGGTEKYIKDIVSDKQRPRYTIRHTPDAVFSLGKNGKAALFFLEIDRGTEAVSNEEKGFLKTLKFYLNYWVDDRYQRYQEEFNIPEPFRNFRTLVVTTSPKRLHHMREACTALSFQPAHAKRFIWLTTYEYMTPGQLFTNIWQSAETGDERRYAIG